MFPIDQSSIIQSNLFVKLDIENYNGAGPTVLAFSDRLEPYELDGDTYIGVGALMAISATHSEIRVSSGTLDISLSGIPNSSNIEILNSRMKGSPVRITRVLFDPVTNEPLAIEGNPLARYVGYINNYSLQEDVNLDDRSSTNTMIIQCNSSVDGLRNKISGRKTNPYSMVRFYPGDTSMDRVPILEYTDFNFGVNE